MRYGFRGQVSVAGPQIDVADASLSRKEPTSASLG